MANLVELQRQAWVTANAGRDNVPQDLIDMYSSASKIGSERAETSSNLSNNLSKTIGSIKSNLDMKIQAWKARYNSELDATPREGDKRLEKVKELIVQIGKEMKATIPDAITEATKLFKVSKEPNLYETVALALALDDYQHQSSENKNTAIATAQKFFSEYNNLGNTNDQEVTMRVFCARALRRGQLEYKTEKSYRGSGRNHQLDAWKAANAGRDGVDVNSL